MSLNQAATITMINDSFIRNVPDSDVRNMAHDIQKRYLLQAREMDCQIIVKDNADLKKENTRARRGNKVDGMSKEGTLRRVATIPLYLFINQPELQADDKALRAYLKKHPEYCTVDSRSI